MSTPSAKLLVLVGKQFACVKISGRASFNSSVQFRTLVEELHAKGFTYFVLDLSECALMDSTFLGVLAGLGMKLGGRLQGPSEPGMELSNANARIIDLLENLGVLRLFKLAQGPLSLPGPTQECALPAAEPSKVEVTTACLEAHHTLMDLNPGNVPKFKDVALFLAEDLKRLKQGSD